MLYRIRKPRIRRVAVVKRPANGRQLILKETHMDDVDLELADLLADAALGRHLLAKTGKQARGEVLDPLGVEIPPPAVADDEDRDEDAEDQSIDERLTAIEEKLQALVDRGAIAKAHESRAFIAKHEATAVKGALATLAKQDGGLQGLVVTDGQMAALGVAVKRANLREHLAAHGTDDLDERLAIAEQFARWDR